MNTHLSRATLRLRGQQRGFTLVELSVAVLIGLFLLGGLLTLVQDMRRTFGNQNQLGQLQDNERLAMTLITDVVQAAGYYPNPTFYVPTSALPFNAAYPNFQPGQGIWGTHNAAPPGDTLWAQYLTAPNDGIINCRGGTNTSGANTVFVNEFSADALGNLNCTFNLLAPVPLISPSGAVGTPRAGGVTNLQVLYGVKRNLVTTNNNADTYLDASKMLFPNDWANIICVKVTLTFDNSALAKSQLGQPATIRFTRVITVMSRGGANT
jgi:type IV pilus assembly protein PilW